MENSKVSSIQPVVVFSSFNQFNSSTQLTDKEKKSPETDDYNPFEHRSVLKPTTNLDAFLHLLKSCLGSGVLTMPMAVSNAGIIFGAVATAIVGFLCSYSLHVLAKISLSICIKAKVPMLGFAETAEKVFEFGPEPLRIWSKFVKEFCDYGLMSAYFACLCVYIIIIAQATHDIVNYNCDIDWNIRIYIGITTIFVLLVGQIRELKYLVPFSAVANAFMLATFCITFYYIFSGDLTFEDKAFIAPWQQWPIFFSTVIFALEGFGTIIPIANSMKHPENFLGCPGVLNIGMTIIVFLFGSLGFFGYLRYGDDVKANVTLNLPKEDIFGQMAQILIGLAILLTFGLQFYAPMEVLFNKIDHRFPSNRYNLCVAITRGVVCIILGAITASIPDLEPFVGLVGAVFFSVLGLLIPCVMETVHLWPNFGAFHWILIKNILLTLFAVMALVSGSVVSVGNIIKLYTDDLS